MLSHGGNLHSNCCNLKTLSVIIVKITLFNGLWKFFSVGDHLQHPHFAHIVHSYIITVFDEQVTCWQTNQRTEMKRAEA